MKIYATCQCCTKKNFIVNNYITGGSFNLTSEFGIRLFNSLLEHLEEIEEVCQKQGHYNKIWIELDTFTEEETKIPEEIIEEYLPGEKKERLKKSKGGKKKADEPPSSNKPPEAPLNMPPPNDPKFPKPPPGSAFDYSTPHTIWEWYQVKQLTYQEYQLLITPWTEEREGDFYLRKVKLGSETPFTWTEIHDYLKRAKESKRKEEEKKREEEELERKMNDGEDWKNIHSNFGEEYWGEERKKAWIRNGFTYEQAKEWISAGISADEEGAFFASWLNEEKKMTAKEVSNYGNLEELEKEYEKLLTERTTYYD
ncbi:MAG: hypothetical protein I3273_06260 [Candidatus Moeniiplasma glomeromycotorum]|nr:hypothetical protein [Candidatus Moeniiplasma glomeromycotorum]MCE8168020.1 hypothetical protein [Candidatus Moeniiplasma glomeromycotorum]MCE8169688.1 hypothetical protein [Candidatus Moeniiplasma glomeromycotorum]